MISNLRHNQAGDTIVEVLIAMAVLGIVLAASFVTANSSLDGEHTAQEHTQALTIAQGQVEDLFAGNQLNSGYHCFNPTDPTDVSVPAVGQYCFVSNTGQFCTSGSTAVPTNSTACPLTATPAYWYEINDTSTTASLPTIPAISASNYEVDVSWPSLTGGTGNVQLYYRPK